MHLAAAVWKNKSSKTNFTTSRTVAFPSFFTRGLADSLCSTSDLTRVKHSL